MMKIAIPVNDGRLCPHFGHCETFAVIDIDDNNKICSIENLTPPPHEPGVLPMWLSELGVNLIIAGGMGQRAQQLFANSGIKVVIGAPSEAPEELVSAYIKDTLATGSNPCDH